MSFVSNIYLDNMTKLTVTSETKLKLTEWKQNYVVLTDDTAFLLQNI